MGAGWRYGNSKQIILLKSKNSLVHFAITIPLTDVIIELTLLVIASAMLAQAVAVMNVSYAIKQMAYRWRKAPFRAITAAVEDMDANQDALRQMEKATGSAPFGEDEELLESPELQRQWREARERLRSQEDRPSAR